jgi:hypothetical protein
MAALQGSCQAAGNCNAPSVSSWPQPAAASPAHITPYIHTGQKTNVTHSLPGSWLGCCGCAPGARMKFTARVTGPGSLVRLGCSCCKIAPRSRPAIFPCPQPFGCGRKRAAALWGCCGRAAISAAARSS